MNEKMNEALEELKRVDHLIYVSLKYTRTVDVILNILNRMIDSYALMIDSLMLYAREKEKISSEPESAIERAELIMRLFASDTLVVDNMRLYLLLRKLLRARHIVRENEYRRHVTMKTVVEGREEIVNIDIITNYFMFQREFIMYVKAIIDGQQEIELADDVTSHPQEPAWMRDEPEEDMTQEKEEVTVVHRTPPKRNTLKVRPVGSPPRKRAPRPKKYKIQIPSEDSISLPYQYDPRFRKEMEKEKAKRRAEAEAKKHPKKVVKRPKKVVKKSVKKKGKKSVKKVVKRPKKVVKKPAKQTVKKRSKSVGKRVTKALKRFVRKATKR